MQLSSQSKIPIRINRRTDFSLILTLWGVWADRKMPQTGCLGRLERPKSV